MPRDAEMTAAPVILANLTALTAEALPPVEAVLARAKDAVRDLVTVTEKSRARRLRRSRPPHMVWPGLPPMLRRCARCKHGPNSWAVRASLVILNN